MPDPQETHGIWIKSVKFQPSELYDSGCRSMKSIDFCVSYDKYKMVKSCITAHNILIDVGSSMKFVLVRKVGVKNHIRLYHGAAIRNGSATIQTPTMMLWCQSYCIVSPRSYQGRLLEHDWDWTLFDLMLDRLASEAYKNGAVIINCITSSVLCICLFGVLRRFQHCTGYITMGSWKGRGNQYI